MRGLPGTAMPAFGTTLSRADLNAVVAYVASLNGIANASVNLGPRTRCRTRERRFPPESERGRALFFDAVRGFARCSTCHEVNGIGIPVTTPIAKIPADAAALRALATPDIRTATVDGEAMPALIVSQGKTRALFYDLTSVPPVLRTVDPGALKVAEGSAWRHSAVISAYNDAELTSILGYSAGSDQMSYGAAIHHIVRGGFHRGLPLLQEAGRARDGTGERRSAFRRPWTKRRTRSP